MEVRVKVRRPAAMLGTVLYVLAAHPAPVQAQSPPPGAAPRQTVEQAVAELRRLVDEQRLLLERQTLLIEAQSRDIEALRRRLDATAAGGSEGGAQAPQPPAPNAPPSPDLPAAVVSAGDFPQSIRIPGTETAVRLGGQARMMLVHSLGPLGTDDRFVTSSIPSEGNEGRGESSRVNYSAAASRVNLDLRSRAQRDVRTFLEADFAGDGRTVRLRHAFIQTGRWIGGQTWSTFSDPEAEPAGLDFEGLNAISLFRQPQVRYTRSLSSSANFSLALENPAPDLTGANGVNVIPDFIARVRWQRLQPTRGRSEHVQGAVLLRGLRGEVAGRPDTTLSTAGFGVNLSGVRVPVWDEDDRVKFAVNAGWGIGRYITDLGTLGGQDGVYDAAANSLRALRVSSGYIGYERMWRPTFTSTVTFGVVTVQNLDIQTEDALRLTQRGTVNLTWSPVPQADIVVEFLRGSRRNKDGTRGTSGQIQAGWLFRF